MQILVNTDEKMKGGEDQSARVAADIHARLDRFSKHITLIEVHLSDQDGKKSGGSDKRCLIQARLEDRQPEVASDNASTHKGAFSGAVKKLQHVLETSLGKCSQVKGADTIRVGD